jgi:hypothetical protein
VTYDETAPTLPAGNIDVNNSIQANTVTVQFDEAVTEALAEDVANWTVTNNGATITYDIATAVLSGGDTVTLTLEAVNPADNTTFITNAAVDAHIIVTPGVAITDLASNAYAGGAVTEAAGTHTKDAGAPTLTPVSIASNNAVTTLAKAGDTVTLTFTSSELIATPVVANVQIDGNNADAVNCVNGAASSVCTATRVMQAGDTEAAVGFTIDFADVSGVAGVQVAAVTDGSSVTYDETAPTVASVTSTSLNDYYNDPDTINVTVTFAENVNVSGNPLVTLETGASDGTCTLAAVSNSLTSTCTYTVADGHNSEDLTVNTIAGGVITDQAGNAIVSYAIPGGQNLADSSNIFVDTLHPVVEAGTNAGTVAAIFTQDATVTELHMGTYAWTAPVVAGYNPYTVTFDVSTEVDPDVSAAGWGSYRILLTATDLAGNTGSDTTDFTWSSLNVPIAGYNPANGATGAAVAAGTATITFAPADPTENITLLDATKVTIVKDSDSSDVSNGAASVSGGNNTSKVLNIPYDALANSTTYRINIYSGAISDEIGHINSDGVSYFTTVSNSDVTAPTISLTSVTPGQTSAAIIFQSTETGTAYIKYGLGSDYGYTTGTSAVTGGVNKTISLTDLTCNTLYHYSIYAKDASLNESHNLGDATFTTSACTATPNVVITTPSAGDTISGNYNVTFTTNGGASTAAQVSIDGGAWDNATSPYSVPTADLTNGSHTIRVKDTVATVTGYSDYVTFIVSNNTQPTEISVTKTNLVKRVATKNGEFADGWRWVLDVTLPTASTTLAMSFDNLTGAGTILAADHIRFYSAQSSDHTSANPIVIDAAGAGTAWSDTMTLNSDLDADATNGRQIQITVQAAVPSGSTSGAYSASYDIQATAD